MPVEAVELLTSSVTARQLRVVDFEIESNASNGIDDEVRSDDDRLAWVVWLLDTRLLT